MTIDLTFDREHIWHPYTSLQKPLPVYPVVSAAGCRLTLENGQTLIDGTSSWWSAVHGYNHPVLNEAVSTQLTKMSHVMFGGITHQPAVDLAKQLCQMLPPSLNKVFFADSGSIAVEVAIKMALQYRLSQGQTAKTKILSFCKAYHGDTFAAMSVCDPHDGMHHMFRSQLIQQLFALAPISTFAGEWHEQDALSLRALFLAHHHEMAALIIEPILQGAGGMRMYHPNFLRVCRALCDEFDVLLIADEIATGFGRTGELFACHHAQVVPDIMCLGKALSGGYITLAATICSEKVAEGIAKGQAPALMHGPTFMANPLACAVALASTQMIANGPWQSQVKAIETQLKLELEKVKQLPMVREVRVLGAIGVVELNGTVNVAKAQQLFVELGVWIRPFGSLLYVMPPFIIEPAELTQLTQALYAVCQQPIIDDTAPMPGA